MTVVDLLLLVFGCFVVGGTLLGISSRRLDAAARRQRYVKILAYFVIVHVVLAAAIAGSTWLLVLGLAIVCLGARELAFALVAIGLQGHSGRIGIGLGYLLLSVGFLVSWSMLRPEAVVFCYLVVAAFDGFSEVSGKLAGSRPLAPRISPGKTVEGMLGGLFGAMVLAAATRSLVSADMLAAVSTAAAIATAALGGDLAASWVKRRAGIKDFGTLLPGQGGVLDRFDSLIMAMALVAPFLVLARLQ